MNKRCMSFLYKTVSRIRGARIDVDKRLCRIGYIVTDLDKRLKLKIASAIHWTSGSHLDYLLSVARTLDNLCRVDSLFKSPLYE